MLPSGNGIDSAFASCQSIETSDAVAELATASIPGLTSRPATEPAAPTRSAANRVTTPVPHATSSTRSPGLRSATAMRS